MRTAPSMYSITALLPRASCNTTCAVGATAPFRKGRSPDFYVFYRLFSLFHG